MKLERVNCNPIFVPNPSNSWEELCVLNPAVIFNDEDNKFYMFYRAAANDKKHTISLGLATSDDGINFKRYSDKPILSGQEGGCDEGGIEDPRIVKIGDYYYLTYASRVFHPGQYWREDKEYFGFQPENGPRSLIYNNTLTHLAVSKDLIHWKKLGRITDPRFDDRDVVIFPEKVNGKYVMLSRGMERCGKGYKNEKPAIYISFSDDLQIFDNYKLLMKGKTEWESLKIGASCPPVKTKDGWLLIYHGVSAKDSIYRVGAVLLDLNKPTKILNRTKNYIFEPEEDFETKGYYSGCVFPTGIVERDGKYFIYYGAGDKVIGLATCNKDELLRFIKENK